MLSFLFGPSKREKELKKENEDFRMKIHRQDKEIDVLTNCLRDRRIELCQHERCLREILLAAKAAVKKAGLPPVETRRADTDL